MLETTQYGILPSGIHEMSLEELASLFDGFPKSPCRLRLFETLKKYVQRLQTLKIGTALIVDGSFMMSCVETPKDIDVILVMPKEWDTTLEKIPQEYYNLLSPVGSEAEFAKIHLFIAADHSWEYHEWIRYFSGIKEDWRFIFDIPHNVSKGLIRVML